MYIVIDINGIYEITDTILSIENKISQLIQAIHYLQQQNEIIINNSVGIGSWSIALSSFIAGLLLMLIFTVMWGKTT